MPSHEVEGQTAESIVKNVHDKLRKATTEIARLEAEVGEKGEIIRNMAIKMVIACKNGTPCIISLNCPKPKFGAVDGFCALGILHHFITAKAQAEGK